MDLILIVLIVLLLLGGGGGYYYGGPIAGGGVGGLLLLLLILWISSGTGVQSSFTEPRASTKPDRCQSTSPRRRCVAASGCHQVVPLIKQPVSAQEPPMSSASAAQASPSL